MNEALNDLFEINGQSAIEKGASSRLGITFAEALAESGVNLTMAARRFKQIEKIAADLRKRLNVYVAPLKCDAIQEDQVISMVNRAVEENGSLEIIVNNVGTATLTPSVGSKFRGME